MKPRVLFVGDHVEFYEIVGELLNVAPVFCADERCAKELLPMVDAVITGFIGRTPEWFDFLERFGKPAAVYSSLIDVGAFKERHPGLSVVMKRSEPGELAALAAVVTPGVIPLASFKG